MNKQESDTIETRTPSEIGFVLRKVKQRRGPDVFRQMARTAAVEESETSKTETRKRKTRG